MLCASRIVDIQPPAKSVEAVLGVPTDHGVANNRRRALLNVEGAGSVLYVTRDAGPTPAARALLEQGLKLHGVAAADFLTASSRLPWHSAVVLDNLAKSAGGLCEGAKALFKSKQDAGYRQLMAILAKAKAALDQKSLDLFLKIDEEFHILCINASLHTKDAWHK